MARPLSSTTLLTFCAVGFVLGCAAKPPEKPIVLRPHHPERRLAHRPSTTKPEAVAEKPASPGEPSSGAPEAAASDATMSAEEKENLFRNFETYLSRTGQSP